MDKSLTVWNSLPETLMRCDSLSSFKSKLKTYFFRKAFDLTLTTDLPPAPLKLRPYGAIQICLLLLLLLLLLTVYMCVRVFVRNHSVIHWPSRSFC